MQEQPSGPPEDELAEPGPEQHQPAVRLTGTHVTLREMDEEQEEQR